ncbi:hypothetical protein D6825_01430 [Candidatus Woesearchaeota archaeon]|nr:MAG: hypothetical protein D6825_01430 [Candidatus Woesearchaeota archaeon]
MRNKKTIRNILLNFGAAVGISGCISMPEPYDPATSLEAKMVAQNVRDQVKKEGVAYSRIVGVEGPRYQAVMSVNDNLYLVDVIDKEDDGEPDALLVYAEKTTKEAKEKLPKAKGNLVNFVLGVHGQRLFEIHDRGLNGYAEESSIQEEFRREKHVSNIADVQRVYSQAIKEVLSFYNKKE